VRTIKYKITVPDANGKPVKIKGKRQLAPGESLNLDVHLPPRHQKPADVEAPITPAQ
jgi:hypothetical protein